MDEREMADMLEGLIGVAACGDVDGCDDAFDPLYDAETDSFEGAGLMTENKGLVLRLADGSAFQITVVRTT